MKRSSAFTLIELLVVIVIVAVLCTLTIAIIGNVRQRTEVSVCASNMRSLGNAINLYQLENNGRYPGPIWYGVRHEVWRMSTYAPLTLILAPYLGLPHVSEMQASTRYRVEAAICPAFLRVNQSPEAAHYSRHFSAAQSPFGGQDSGSPQEFTPFSIYNVSEHFNKRLSDIVALRDDPPPAPATRHNGGQNVLFLDGHVEWLPGRLFPNRD